MKILLIPSWYPTAGNPLSGSFCREQALLMMPECDIKVLYPHFVGRKQYLIGKLRGQKIGDKLNPITPPAFSSFACFDSVGMFSKQKLDFALRQGVKQLSEMLSDSWKPDLIHAHCCVYGGIFAVLLGKKFGLPVIITEHSNPFRLDIYPEFLADTARFAFEQANKVLAVSQYLSRSIISHSINVHPTVVGNMVDDELFGIGEKKAGSEVFNILTITGSHFYKDLLTFLKSLKRLKCSGFTKFLATIVSISPISEEHQQYIEQNDLAENCRVFEGVARSGMPDFYLNSDVVVSTSISETFGISLAEGLACGKPVLTTRNGGAEDFVIHGENGYLFNIRDDESLANYLLNIASNGFPKSQSTLRQSITAGFGRKAFKKRIMDIYESVSGENGYAN